MWTEGRTSYQTSYPLHAWLLTPMLVLTSVHGVEFAWPADDYVGVGGLCMLVERKGVEYEESAKGRRREVRPWRKVAATLCVNRKKAEGTDLLVRCDYCALFVIDSL